MALRGLCVVLLSGQCLEVKCDVTSTVGAVFSAIAPFASLGELTYFGLAYLKGEWLPGWPDTSGSPGVSVCVW